MAKILDTDFRTGSYISKDGVVGTNSGSVFQKTEKGLAPRFTRNEYVSYSLPSTFSGNQISYIVWIKPYAGQDLSSHIVCGNTYSNRVTYIPSGELFFSSGPAGGSGITVGASLIYGKWNFVYVQAYNFGIGFKTRAYVNGVLYNESTNSNAYPLSTISSLYVGRWDGDSQYGMGGNIAKVEMYDSLLSQSEIEDKYKEFIYSQPLEDTKREFVEVKPTDLSDQIGLVCAYNMIPQDQKLIDISGNNNHGTIIGCTSREDGLYFDGVRSYVSMPYLFSTTVYTFAMRINFKTLIDHSYIFCSRDASIINSFMLEVDNTGRINGSYYQNPGPGFIKLVRSPVSSIASDKDFTIIYILDFSGGHKIYINGVLQILSEGLDLSASIPMLGSRNGTSFFCNAIYKDFKIYNRVLTEQEIKDYHNSFCDVVLKDDFSSDGVGMYPKQWIKGTGVYSVQELSVNDSVLPHLQKGTKYLKCTTSGTLAIPSDTAYGEWEFDLFKGTDSTQQIIYFTSTDTNNFQTGSGYRMAFLDTEGVFLSSKNGGAVSTLFGSITSYIQFNIWYSLLITRTNVGVFTVYIKGGSFGNTWTLISTYGGSGTNPITNNTYTTSKFFVLDLDANDCIANIEIRNGIKQL